jgi:hypothetical protein
MDEQQQVLVWLEKPKRKEEREKRRGKEGLLGRTERKRETAFYGQLAGSKGR